MGRMRTIGWPAPPLRVVMHIDMDAFFAAVEEQFLPILRGRPVVVGGPPGARGVASTANYEARRYGIHSAMPLRTAARLCPHATFVTASHGAYGDFSDRLMEIFQGMAPKVEQTSVDEAFLEITGMHRHFASPAALALDLKRQVLSGLGLTCSVGIAPNKLLAKMASSQYKPDGLFHVDPERIQAWLAPQPVGRLWGVGVHTELTLSKLGIRTIGDLQRLSPEALTRRFGKWGQVMYKLARGLDNAPVLNRHERPREKSVGHEHTFDVDTDDPVLWHATLLALSDRVARRLRRAGVRGTIVTLKFRTDDFRTRTHAETLPHATDLERVIFGSACRLLEDLDPSGCRVRLLGVSVSRLRGEGDASQAQLFADGASARDGRVTRAMDRIRDRYGAQAIVRLGSRA